MKAKLLALLISLVITTCTWAQNQNNFKYQAILRDNQSNLIADEQVDIRITILQGSTDGSPIYSEEHVLTTNNKGLVFLNIGSGTIISGAFNTIDWASNSHYLQIELNRNNKGFIVMGTSPLLSVPYALHAQSVSNTDDADADPDNEIQSISISGDTLQLSNNGGSVKLPAKVLGANGDEVIFCVVNDNNDTVFAVYQGGVRVFVDDGTTKAARGGFAVATRSASKGTITSDILSVSNDSVRIYLEETVKNKAARGGFAVATRSASKNTSSDILSVNSKSTSVYIGDANQGFNVVNTENLQNESLMRLTEENYLIGHNSGASITSGLYNLFLGYESGFSNTNASNNTFLGYMSGKSNTGGASNVFIGNSTGMNTTNSSQNVVIGNSCASDVSSVLSKSIIMGDNALTAMATSIPVYSSLFMGDNAGISLGSGSTKVSSCIFLGTNAGEGIKTTSVHGSTYSSIGISSVVAIGSSSGKNADGYRNVFIGSSAGSAFVGNHNTMIGFSVGTQGGSGTYNVYLGDQVALDSDGSSNTYIGRTAGSWVNGDYNVFLGYNAGRASSASPRTESNRLRIGSNNLIYGEFDTKLVQINDDLNVNGTFSYVKGIYEKADNSKITKSSNFTNGLALLNNINPYYFEFTDEENAKENLHLGVNATKLQEVLPELVREEKDGSLSINYSKISIVAVNAIKEQQVIIEKQQEELNSVSEELGNVKNELAELKKMVLELNK